MTDFSGVGHQAREMNLAAVVLPDETDGRPGTAPRASGISALLTFDAVYEGYFDFVWRSVRRLGVDPFAADDVVQEVFFVVHRKLGEFEGRSSLKTWLFTIVLQFVRHHRRTRRRKELRREEGQNPRDPDHLPDARQPGPLESAETADAVRLLDRLLHELDDEKRDVFVLAELEQMTAGEIAEVVGVNANTVYSRLRAARQEFEQALARHRARDARRRP
ncbi:MAG TPA: sigma-70 family RNA polymerase sigma factor [Polyangiaceae bacterium]